MKAKKQDQPDTLPLGSELLRPLSSEQTVKVGDYWLLNTTWYLIEKPCAYDPGCCTGVKAGNQEASYARLKEKNMGFGETMTGVPGPALRLNELLPEAEYRYLYAMLTEGDPASEVGRSLFSRLAESMGKKLDAINAKRSKKGEK